MRLLTNRGSDRVVDQLRGAERVARLSVVASEITLSGLARLVELARTASQKLILPPADENKLFGAADDRALRNALNLRGAAAAVERWLGRAEYRWSASRPAQSAIIAEAPDRTLAMVGACAPTTAGLGLAPAAPVSLVHLAETELEVAQLAAWFDQQWQALPLSPPAGSDLLTLLRDGGRRRSAAQVHLRMLEHVFGGADEPDADRIVRSATGIRETVVWSKLYRFQRDGAIGAIDKLQKYGGCILADSVGLGKTFEALAVIKYHELRNDRVLVLCPKRLRDNWTLPKTNDRRNALAKDRFAYDVLNHTDLTREDGRSGDIDLAHVNWGNYDLVVIDESHNFRNTPTHRERRSRYDQLMNAVVRAGVKTRVLMLSATPVNNRLADLRNQIAFATEGDDGALRAEGVTSIEGTTRVAQAQFNRWLALPEAKRTTERLLDALGFDYFRLLDLITIARSRKHIVRYYGTSETGAFPERLPPVNLKPPVDLAGDFPPIADVNTSIRKLTLAAYAPLRYVLPSKQAAYDRAYTQEVRGGTSVFRQLDREESLIALMRVNLLKRMESSVASFRLTVGRQLHTVEELIARIDAHEESVGEPSIDELDLDDPLFESLAVGRSVRVLLADADRVRWRQDLADDRDNLRQLLDLATAVTAARDAKLAELKRFIAAKLAAPLNDGNRKIIVFTAFADTANYLYGELASAVGVEAALVTGGGPNRTTLKGLRTDLASILTAFSPRSKGRPADMADEGEIELLIATDVISEGQNLQDCDCLVNYDIHWNPVRIVQRFGRIDRIGSPNAVVQLVNFWPNMELDAYIGLERRVSGRMKLLDVSATGEENIIEAQSGDVMNDLDYRRRQLEALQTTVVDLEDLSGGVSIADLTLSDLRVDLAELTSEQRAKLRTLPLTTHAAVWADDVVPAGAIFCLRGETAAALGTLAEADPLRPYALVHVGEDSAVVLGPAQAKRILDSTKYLSDRGAEVDEAAWDRLDAITRDARDMSAWRDLLAAAVAAVTGKAEARAIDSLFTAGATTDPATFAGVDDWEVVAWFAVLPRPR